MMEVRARMNSPKQSSKCVPLLIHASRLQNINGETKTDQIERPKGPKQEHL